IHVDVNLADRPAPVTLGIERLSFTSSADQREMDASIGLPERLGRRVEVSASQRRSGAGEPAPWRLFLEGDGLNVAGFSSLWPNGFRVLSGLADLQFWLELADGAARGATANFALTDVRVVREPAGREATAPRPFSAEGRAEFARGDQGWLVAADELVMTTPRGEWPKTSFTLRVTSGDGGAVERVKANATYLDFDDIPFLAALIPGPWRARLEALAPSGVLRDLDLTVIDPASPERRFNVSATMERAGVSAWRSWPGLRGFSGSIRADQSGGRLEMAATDMLLSFPSWFAEPIAVEEAAGTLVWRRSAPGTTILSNSVRIRNADVDTVSSLQITLPADGKSPLVDLQSHWSAARIAAIEHYLPARVLKPGLTRWLGDALVAGQVTSATTRLSGALAAFPFDGGEGTFRTDARIENAVLRYAGNWPDVEGIAADLVIDGTRLYSIENSAVSAGNRILDAHVEIPDLRRPVVSLEAHASGTLQSLYRFARSSPIDSLFGGQLARVGVEGGADLDLRLSYPVLDREEYAFTTVIRSDGGNLSVEGLPAPITEIRGSVTVTRDELVSEALAGRFLGSPITVDLMRAGADLPAYSAVARVRGTVGAVGLREGFGMPLADRLHGEATYDASVRFPNPGEETPPVPLEILIASDLEGMALELPAPLGKPPGAASRLSFGITFPEDGRIVSSGSLADSVRWSLDFARGDAGWDFDRGVLALGGAAPGEPATRGLHIEGSTPVLDANEWLKLARPGGEGPAFGERIRSIDLVVDDLRVIGQELSRHHVIVDRSAFGWVVQLDGADVVGSITVPYDFSGKRPIELDMLKLTLPGSEEAEPAAVDQLTDPRSLPGIDVSARDFSLGKRHFGSLHADFLRTARGLEAATIDTESATFGITGSAGWVVDESDASGQRTYVKARLTSSDVQRTFEALDYQPGMEGESMDVQLDVSWSGGPKQEFLASLDGNVRVRFGTGQLAEIEPGAGRVFGLMSVVALPRRLSLDFSDVFERGLGFDEITGNFRLKDGEAYTCDLSLKGPAADVGIVGRTGLVDKVYDQAGVVSANVGNTLPVVGAVVAGPQIAAALLIFSQIFKKPLQEMGQIYYGIGGTWENPAVDAIDAHRFAEVSETAGCLRKKAS
ncbi:MAG TPA: YhdP family protein, partial [Woeseiaceae bacterium]|nr:YhdP family protein [Woeseiaceae bacterium]